PARYIDSIYGPEGLGPIIRCNQKTAGLRIERRAPGRGHAHRVVPRRMPLVRAPGSGDARKHVGAAEPCEAGCEMGDLDAERGLAPGATIIPRGRDGRAALLRRGRRAP